MIYNMMIWYKYTESNDYYYQSNQHITWQQHILTCTSLWTSCYYCLYQLQKANESGDRYCSDEKTLTPVLWYNVAHLWGVIGRSNGLKEMKPNWKMASYKHFSKHGNNICGLIRQRPVVKQASSYHC